MITGVYRKGLTMVRVNVRVEKQHDMYHGEATGEIVFHTMERGRSGVIRHGCPLGRGATEVASIQDFCFRANLDDAELNLRPVDVEVAGRHDWT